jgi:hypothetical protein
MRAIIAGREDGGHDEGGGVEARFAALASERAEGG